MEAGVREDVVVAAVIVVQVRDDDVLDLVGATSIALSPSRSGGSSLRPRFFAIAVSKPVSTTKLPLGPLIAQTK
jgi:hypothetical protein